MHNTRHFIKSVDDSINSNNHQILFLMETIAQYNYFADLRHLRQILSLFSMEIIMKVNVVNVNFPLLVIFFESKEESLY